MQINYENSILFDCDKDFEAQFVGDRKRLFEIMKTLNRGRKILSQNPEENFVTLDIGKDFAFVLNSGRPSSRSVIFRKLHNEKSDKIYELYRVPNTKILVSVLGGNATAEIHKGGQFYITARTEYSQAITLNDENQFYLSYYTGDRLNTRPLTFRNFDNLNKNAQSYVLNRIEKTVSSYKWQFFNEFIGSKTPISFSKVLSDRYQTKYDILSTYRKNLPKSVNKVSVNYSFYLTKLMPYLKEDDITRFFQKDFLDKVKDIVSESPSDILSYYLVTEKDFFVSAYELDRILRNLKEHKETLTLTRAGIEKIAEREHFEGIELKNLSIDEVYIRLASYLGKNYTLLTTNHALIREGMRQHNCVAGYESRVNNGSCAIFTSDDEDEHFTIEIQNRFNHFIINQFLSACNRKTEKAYQNEQVLQKLIADYEAIDSKDIAV